MSTLLWLAAIVGGFSGLLGIPSLFFLIASARRESRALREKPLVEALKAMEEDRNYWRGKADNLESRMQGRESHQ